MELPILDRLKDGEKFDFATLASNVEQTDEFWEWWWAQRFKPGSISRPEIVVESDPILVPAIQKCVVDLTANAQFFDNPLSRLIRLGILPSLGNVPRETFRDFVLRFVAANNATTLPGRHQVVFAGGGYGSGKTTALNFLAHSGALPVQLGHHVGVDVFKLLVPEFNLIKAVADGRASLTVQEECQELASELFEMLVEGRRSFIWDSSMSNQTGTIERLKAAQAADYELTMIAVLTPLELAIKQAMERAFDSRRFPHPTALPQSHTGFRQAFTGYLPYFDNVKVFVRLDGSADAMLIAERGATKELVIFDENLFNCALLG